MDYMVVISAVVLGLSVLATLAKFLDWFIHSDPRTMVRPGPGELWVNNLAGGRHPDRCHTIQGELQEYQGGGHLTIP